MSSEIFPTLVGTKLDVNRPVQYSTGVQESVSGKEYRALWFNRPRTRYALDVEVLRQGAQQGNLTEWQQLVSFYQRHGGQFDSFLFTDPDDYTIPITSPMRFGKGDGSTTAFQLQRTLTPEQRFRSKLLFTYTPGDSLTALGAVFVRATAATYRDKYGVLRTAASGEVRDAHYINGVRTLLIEGVPGTNTCIRSQEFDNASWVKTNVLVTANAITAPDATLTADRLTNDVTLPAFVGIVVAMTADGTKVASTFIKQGTAAAVDLLWRDTTAAATRHHVRFTFNGTAAPTGATQSGTGVIYTPEDAGNGWWRVATTADGVIAANTNTLYFYPGAAGSAGDYSYIWGTQTENAVAPSSYIATTTVAVTRNADVLYFPFLPRPQGQTLYLAGIEQMAASSTQLTTTVPAGISDGSGAVPRLYFRRPSGANGYRFVHEPSTPVETASVGTTATRGDLVELRGVLGSTGTATIGASVNSGAETTSGPSSALALLSAWSAQRLYLSTLGSIAAGRFAFTRVLMFAGTKTMTECRTASAEPSSVPAFYPDYTDGYEPVKAFSGLPVLYADGIALVAGFDWTMTDEGLVTFTTAPVTGTQLSWSGTYYKRVRWASDQWATRRMMLSLWDSSTLDMIEVL